MKLEDLKKIREKMESEKNVRTGNARIKVVVGMGTCGIAAGARDVMSAIMDELGKRNIKDIIVTQAGCRGLCEVEPVIDVYEGEKSTVTYGRLDAEKARRIVVEHLVNGNIVSDFVITAK